MLKTGSEYCTGVSLQPPGWAPTSDSERNVLVFSGNILVLPVLKSRATSSTLSLLCKLGPLHSPHSLLTEDTFLLGDPSLPLFSGHFSLNFLPPLRRQVRQPHQFTPSPERFNGFQAKAIIWEATGPGTSYSSLSTQCLEPCRVKGTRKPGGSRGVRGGPVHAPRALLLPSWPDPRQSGKSC